MIPVERVRSLRLDRSEGASRSAGIAAASGLAVLGDTLYVVSDDELYLAIFGAMGETPGHTVHFLPGHLPEDYEERKDEKPDLESLTPLDTFGPFEQGGLIALGSGSSPHRRHGALAALGPDGTVSETVRIDAGPLFEHLAGRIEGLNLEGTAVVGDSFRILQRGNEPGATNAHVDLSLDGLREALVSRGPLEAHLVEDIVQHDLGRIHGTDLCFSDADTLSDGRVAFSASAETSEQGQDGALIGSGIGIMSAAGDIESLEPIDVKVKVEGLATVETRDGIEAYMVTDEDDPNTPTDLLRVLLNR